jgi:hypothetical protein
MIKVSSFDTSTRVKNLITNFNFFKNVKIHTFPAYITAPNTVTNSSAMHKFVLSYYMQKISEYYLTKKLD